MNKDIPMVFLLKELLPFSTYKYLIASNFHLSGPELL